MRSGINKLMHISEGILSGPVLAAGAVFAAAGTGIGLKKLDSNRMVHVAVLASSFFVASLIHVSWGITSTHLVLNGILGLLLGFAAFPAILAALLLQAVFFQFGGLTALGVNVLVMAIPAVASHYLFRPFLKKSGRTAFIAGFCAGGFSIAFSSVLLAGALWFTEEQFFKTCLYILGLNVPVMIIEAIVTGFCVSFLLKVYPEIIR